MIILCPYCIGPAKLVTGREIYSGEHATPKPFWACLPCKAWVGCHPGTVHPLGRLADKELRLAKMAAHAAFDPMWKHADKRRGLSKKGARDQAYKWLAETLGLSRDDCHVGMMDIETCRRVVTACREHQRKAAA